MKEKRWWTEGDQRQDKGQTKGNCEEEREVIVMTWGGLGADKKRTWVDKEQSNG